MAFVTSCECSRYYRLD